MCDWQITSQTDISTVDTIDFSTERYSCHINLGEVLERHTIKLSLIREAEREHWINALIQAAHEENESNVCLAEFAGKMWLLRSERE